ncbi:Pycsar system effector family protein [Mesorhizobium sp. CAU 1732]|uniref:Pycsar system effector family protein n=1 Tax=Mesorhizobium sp. CAU 1732 TaxID=3140358 RepID=UPI0032608B16
MTEKAVDHLISASVSDGSLEAIVERGHYLDHLKKVNDVYYDQIKIADQKAAYIFTFMLAFLISSAEGRGVFSIKRYMNEAWLPVFMSGLMAIAVLCSLIAAVLVVLPRKASAGTSLYWGAWPANRARFIEADRTGDPEFLTREYLGNVDALAAIARKKFRFVALAFRGLLATVVAYVLLLTFG